MGDFPEWVSSMEKDSLLWISDTQGRVLGMRFVTGAIFFFVVVVGLKRDFSWREVSSWQVARGSPTMACTCCYAGSLPHDEGHSLGFVSLGGILVALGWAQVPSDVDIGQRIADAKAQ